MYSDIPKYNVSLSVLVTAGKTVPDLYRTCPPFKLLLALRHSYNSLFNSVIAYQKVR